MVREWPLTEEFDGLRKHLITEHGVLDADELGDSLAVAEHYAQHFSPDGGRTPAKGTWGHRFDDLSYNQDIDLDVVEDPFTVRGNDLFGTKGFR